MATKEAPELTFCHGHTEFTATYGITPSERNSETSWVTPTCPVKEKKKKVSKLIEEAETHLTLNSTLMTTFSCKELPTSNFSLRSGGFGLGNLENFHLSYRPPKHLAQNVQEYVSQDYSTQRNHS